MLSFYFSFFLKKRKNKSMLLFHQAERKAWMSKVTKEERLCRKLAGFKSFPKGKKARSHD